MKNNPIIPYILIMAFGIGLIFFMSLEGTGNKEEIAAGHEEGAAGEEGATASEGAGGEELVSACIACHGGDLHGGMGPQIAGLDAEHIVDVLTNGIEGSPMTPGLRTGAEAEAIAEYISSLE
ncbi:MAG TPA: cytochrome c [Ureibacillus sp.]|nr:cytochrome c [Ureibacillus sp.]